MQLNILCLVLLGASLQKDERLATRLREADPYRLMNIKTLVLGKLRLYMSFWITSPQYFFSLSPALLRSSSVNLSHLHTRAYVNLLLKYRNHLSLACCNLFLYRGYFHLSPNIFISDHISRSKPTHPCQHPHFHNFHLLNERGLD